MFSFKPLVSDESESSDSNESENSNDSTADSSDEEEDLNDATDQENGSKIADTNESIDLSLIRSGKESEEVRIMAAYQKSLNFCVQEDDDRALSLLSSILASPLFKNKIIPSQLGSVKFATCKMLATISIRKQNHNEAIQYLKQALDQENKDVTLWLRLCKTARKINDFDLALQAAMNALKINPRYWPALDEAVLLSYALVHFEICLEFCSSALDKDRLYETGIYCIQNILSYQPCLKTMIASTLESIPDLLEYEVSNEEKIQFDQEVAQIKTIIRQQLKEEYEKDCYDSVDFLPLKVLSWSNLASALVSMHQNLNSKSKLPAMVNMKSLLPDDLATLLLPDERKNNSNDGPIKPNNSEVMTDFSSVPKPEKPSTKKFRFSDFVEKRRSARTRVDPSQNESNIVSNSKNDSLDLRIFLSKLLPAKIKDMSEKEAEKYQQERSLRAKFRAEEQAKRLQQEDNEGVSSLKDEDPVVISELINELGNGQPTIMHVVLKFLQKVAMLSNYKWPESLVKDFLYLYNETMPSCASWSGFNLTDVLYLPVINLYLIYSELVLDEKQSEFIKTQTKPTEKCRCLSEFLGYHDMNTLFQLMSELDQNDLETKRLFGRCHWLIYVLSFLREDHEEVKDNLEIMKILFEDYPELKISRPNCNNGCFISKCTLETYLSLAAEQCSTEYLQKCFDNENYQEVILKVRQSLKTKTILHDSQEMGDSDSRRQREFALLAQAEILLEDTNNQSNSKESFLHWLLCLEECSSILDNMETVSLKKLSWMKATLDVLKAMNRSWLFLRDRDISTSTIPKEEDCEHSDEFVLESNVLSHTLCLAMNILIELVTLEEERLADNPAATQTNNTAASGVKYSEKIEIPSSIWIMLSEVTHVLECRMPAALYHSVTRNPTEEIDLPVSLALLHAAHDYLAHYCEGRSCGPLLRHIIHQTNRVIRPAVTHAGPNRYPRFPGDITDASIMLEQAAYCMCRLSRKVKAANTNIEEHNCESMELDWDTSLVLIEFFKPETLPEFDSVKTLSISNDLCSMLQTGVSLIPSDQLKYGCSKEEVNKAIEETSHLKPNESIPENSVLKYIFYLIADFHFKNNDFPKAIEYCMEDLRYNPLRFDSWAVLALMFSNQISQIINLTNPNTEEIDDLSVKRCFQCFSVAESLRKAGDHSTTFLLEKASLAYEIMSYSNRILRHSNIREVNRKQLELSSSWRNQMLDQAEQCYKLGLQHDGDDSEEAWLYYYMLAKIAEKRLPPHAANIQHILTLYTKSANSLDSFGAKYPKKITIYNKLPYRAVEAIEIYYRMHALVLKRLLNLDTVTKLPLDQLRDMEIFLLDQTKSHFITKMGKPSVTKTPGTLKRKRNINSKQTIGVHPQDKRSRLEIGGNPTDRPSSSGPAEEMAVVDPQSGAAPSSTQMSDDSELETDMDIAPPASTGEAANLDAIDQDVEDCLVNIVQLVSTRTPHTTVKDLWETSWNRCISLCFNGMQIVLQRLPLHYKAMYHVANVFLNAKTFQDNVKAVETLLGPLDGSKTNATVALFKDRKPGNFFQGVWRIPVSDIDRSGNFASHMYRSVNLLLNILRKLNDWKRLLNLHTYLRKPSPDYKKGFISESDRLYLARRAFGHAQISLHEWLTSQGQLSTDVLIQVARVRTQAVKYSQGVANMNNVLIAAFNKCPKARFNMEPSEEVTIDEVLRRCSIIYKSSKEKSDK